ncbi:MAG: anion permease [Paracoccus sp. (in: a-proteobacteria)]|nr:anion permease [Paracoccus sp. (in: a-proteobacteria)]
MHLLAVGTPPNCIVLGTGVVTIGQMARGGLVLNIVGVVLITGSFTCWVVWPSASVSRRDRARQHGGPATGAAFPYGRSALR